MYCVIMHIRENNNLGDNMSARSFDLNKVNRTQSNIRVIEEDGAKIVLLYGHAIVKIYEDRIILSSCGWLTMTSKTAINRALHQIKDVNYGVSQIKGQWYINGDKFHDGYTIYRTKVMKDRKSVV